MIKINEQTLSKTIEDILKDSKTESAYYDFKEEWYGPDDNGNLIMDFLAFSNSTYNDLSYIIIGVTNAGEIKGVDETIHLNEKNDEVTQIIREAPFSGGIRPDFRITSIKIQEKRLDVIVIESNSHNIPFFLTKSYPSKGDYRKRAGIGIIVRNQATNTPRDQNADRNIIENLWKRKFGNEDIFDPLEQFRIYLKDVKMWSPNYEESGLSYLLFYKTNPAYAILFDLDSSDDEKQTQTIYQVIQTDFKPVSFTLRLFLWSRVIYCCTMEELDGGRAEVPVPEERFIENKSSNENYSFRYFTKDSIDFSIVFFCLRNNYNSESKEAVRRVFEVVDLYEDEDEVAHLKEFVMLHLNEYCDMVAWIQKEQYFVGKLIDCASELEKNALKRKIASSQAMMRMHKRWRKENGFQDIFNDALPTEHVFVEKAENE
ncbi:MAG: ATP-binding protein [Bacilli bacterium]|jgi:hypothetical protein|nr:ATP-binding protein [Bacilli bacterium]